MSSRSALLAAAASLALVGCAGAGAAGPIALLAAVALVAAACSTPARNNGGAADATADAQSDAIADTATDAAVDTGPDAAADTVLGDATADAADVLADATPDVPDALGDTVADTAGDVGEDAAGAWEPCCQDGKVSTCFCPANTECNYGLFTPCGDGTCTLGGTCPTDVVEDGGPTDTAEDGGSWSPCCTEGKITTCYCPPGAICNFVPYAECGGGVCAPTGTPCPAEPDAGGTDDAGTWDPCCQDGKVTTCFCPTGVACNYGWFKDCGEGTCVMPMDQCP